MSFSIKSIEPPPRPTEETRVSEGRPEAYLAWRPCSRAKTSLCVLEAQRLCGGYGSTSLQAEKSLGVLHPWSNVSFSSSQGVQTRDLRQGHSRRLLQLRKEAGRAQAHCYSRSSSGVQGSSRIMWTRTLQGLPVTRVASRECGGRGRGVQGWGSLPGVELFRLPAPGRSASDA